MYSLEVFQSGETCTERKEHVLTSAHKYETCEKSLVIRPHCDVIYSSGVVKSLDAGGGDEMKRELRIWM